MEKEVIELVIDLELGGWTCEHIDKSNRHLLKGAYNGKLPLTWYLKNDARSFSRFYLAALLMYSIHSQPVPHNGTTEQYKSICMGKAYKPPKRKQKVFF